MKLGNINIYYWFGIYFLKITCSYLSYLNNVITSLYATMKKRLKLYKMISLFYLVCIYLSFICNTITVNIFMVRSKKNDQSPVWSNKLPGLVAYKNVMSNIECAVNCYDHENCMHFAIYKLSNGSGDIIQCILSQSTTGPPLDVVSCYNTNVCMYVICWKSFYICNLDIKGKTNNSRRNVHYYIFLKTWKFQNSYCPDAKLSFYR